MSQSSLPSPSIDAETEQSELERLKAILRKISDPQEREIAEVFLLKQLIGLAAEKRHIVVLIHGMNTDAEWQEALADQLRDEYGVETYPIGYGNFKPWRFLCPLFTRQAPINVVVRELRSLRAANPDAHISVVAHSFGTYILSKILQEETDLGFYRVQLCGAVIDTEYRWDKVKSRVVQQIVNDVGSRDLWPMLARTSTWGYGDSGTFGFKKTYVRDRHFDYGHSDFMTRDHVTKYWKPLLVDGQVVSSEWTKQRTRHGLKVWLLRRIPLKVLWIILPGLVIWAIWNWRLIWDHVGASVVHLRHLMGLG